MSFKKREGPLLLTAIVTLIVISEYYLQIPTVVSTATFLNRSGVILAAFFLGFGIINLSRTHIKIISRKGEKWQFSLWMILLLVITVISGLLAPRTKHPVFSFIFDSMYSPLHATVYSILAFALASIAYRAFRIKTLESTLLLFFAIVAMLRNAPVGPALFPPVDWLGDWILSTVSVGVNRGMLIAVALGVVSAGIRTLLGRERGYLGAEESDV